jgi:tetrahydromethanopterin S-methyltransferase subunit B
MNGSLFRRILNGYDLYPSREGLSKFSGYFRSDIHGSAKVSQYMQLVNIAKGNKTACVGDYQLIVIIAGHS